MASGFTAELDPTTFKLNDMNLDDYRAKWDDLFPHLGWIAARARSG